MKIPYLIILLAVFLLGSCDIMDDEACSDQPSPMAAPVQVGFTLTTGNVASRAITEGTETGTGLDNYIDIEGNDFRILFFDAGDDTYLTTFTPTRIYRTGDDELTYHVEGELEEAYTEFKLVVLANWGKDNYREDLEQGKTKIGDICDAVYSYKGDTDLMIPMYGVHTYNDIEWRAGLLTELPDEVDLLRAMAKIEVKCSADGFKLNGVTLHRYNTTGYCAPTGIVCDTQKEWDNPADEVEVCKHTVHIPDGAQKGTELPFTPQGDSYIAYVPEFENKGAVDKSYISVSLVHENGASVFLDDSTIIFCEYNGGGTPVEGTDFDIVRNHWYTYDITQVNDGKEVEFRICVIPWGTKEITIPDFGVWPINKEQL